MRAPIPLIVAQRTAYVWNVDDIATLRTDHQICGVLSGTLPHLSQQNVFLGVPLILMPEEAVYLVEKQGAVFVNDCQGHFTPSDAQLQNWVSEQDALSHQLLISHIKETGRSAPGHVMSEAALKKRREREESKAKLTVTDQDAALDTSPALTPIQSAQGTHQSSTYTLTIPASSTTFDWYLPNSEGCVYSSVESAKQAGIWDFPSSPHERSRCAIFRDLREKGYFIGGGIKFGGEYLVYPGDPLRYHSHFVATVQDSFDSNIRPMEVVAHGRLGTATKKTHLICAWDDVENKASYLSIEWAGFG